MAAVEVFSGIVVIIVVWCLFFRKKIDPLYQIPEPWGWPILKHLPLFWDSDHLDVYEKLAQAYRDVGLFRINNLTLPEQVVLLDPDYPKHVFTHPDVFVRSDLLNKACPFFEKGLLQAKGSEHRWQKTLLAKAFTPDKQKVYVDVGNKYADAFVESWLLEVEEGGNGVNIPVLKPLQTLTFQVMCEASCSWGSSSGGIHPSSPSLDEAKFVSACKTILDLITSGSKSKLLFRIFPFLDYLPFGPGKKKKEAIQGAHEEIVKIMAKRKEEMKSGSIHPNHEKDFLSIMFRAQEEDPEQKMTDRHIHDNIFTFLLGAFETTSTALMWCLYVFGIYPEVQKKSRDEVIEVMGSRDYVGMEDIPRLKYLTNVIRETLRVYNASIRVGRVTTKPCKLGPFNLPKGQMIKTVFNLFHMNEDLFPQPHEFKPERFEQEGDIKPGSWLAFGYGPYSCIGKKFAMNEMRVILAKLLRQFSFSVDGDKREFRRRIQLALRAEPDVVVRVKRLPSTK